MFLDLWKIIKFIFNFFQNKFCDLFSIIRLIELFKYTGILRNWIPIVQRIFWDKLDLVPRHPNREGFTIPIKNCDVISHGLIEKLECDTQFNGVINNSGTILVTYSSKRFAPSPLEWSFHVSDGWHSLMRPSLMSQYSVVAHRQTEEISHNTRSLSYGSPPFVDSAGRRHSGLCKWVISRNLETFRGHRVTNSREPGMHGRFQTSISPHAVHNRNKNMQVGCLLLVLLSRIFYETQTRCL